MQANYDVLNVVWETVDTQPSESQRWLQMFSTHFPCDICYLLFLKTILIPRQTQQINTYSKSIKYILEQGVNYFQN